MRATRIEVPEYMQRYADEDDAWHVQHAGDARHATPQPGIVNGADPRAANPPGTRRELVSAEAALAGCT